MTRRLLRLQDLDYQEPSKYCKLWEANTLAAVARAVGSAEHSSPHRNLVEPHDSADGLLTDKALKSLGNDGLSAAKRVRTGLNVGAADRVPAAGRLQHTCTATAQQLRLAGRPAVRPATAAAQKHVPAHTQHVWQQAMPQGSRHAQLPNALASIEVPQKPARLGLTDHADAMAPCTDNISSALRLHTHLLHDAASTGAPSCPSCQAQYANPARVQPVHQYPAISAPEFSCSRSGQHVLRLVEVFSQELGSLPQAPRERQQVHNDLLLFYLEAAAAGPL